MWAMYDIICTYKQHFKFLFIFFSKMYSDKNTFLSSHAPRKLNQTESDRKLGKKPKQSLKGFCLFSTWKKDTFIQM